MLKPGRVLALSLCALAYCGLAQATPVNDSPVPIQSEDAWLIGIDGRILPLGQRHKSVPFDLDIITPNNAAKGAGAVLQSAKATRLVDTCPLEGQDPLLQLAPSVACSLIETNKFAGLNDGRDNRDGRVTKETLLDYAYDPNTAVLGSGRSQQGAAQRGDELSFAVDLRNWSRAMLKDRWLELRHSEVGQAIDGLKGIIAAQEALENQSVFADKPKVNKQNGQAASAPDLSLGGESLLPDWLFDIYSYKFWLLVGALLLLLALFA